VWQFYAGDISPPVECSSIYFVTQFQTVFSFSVRTQAWSPH
jgi:hypothetical protein